MTRYWAIRTDQSRRASIWSEVQAGRLREAWGYRPDMDLETLAEIRRLGGGLEKHQQDAWRGNRRLLPSQSDSMQVGDIAILLHLPRYGVWSIARVTGGYHYQISPQGNAVDGTPDYGHIREVEPVTDHRGVDPGREAVSEAFRRSTRPQSRMWSIDLYGDEIEPPATGPIGTTSS